MIPSLHRGTRATSHRSVAEVAARASESAPRGPGGYVLRRLARAAAHAPPSDAAIFSVLAQPELAWVDHTSQSKCKRSLRNNLL